MVTLMKNYLQRFKTEPSQHTETSRVGRFGVIGILNTALDFALYNLLSLIGLPLYAANICSTAVAMAFSYQANKHVVFADHDHVPDGQTIRFFAVTAIGLWVIQTGIIQLLTDHIAIGALNLSFHTPITVGISAAHAAGLGTVILPHVFSDSFLVRNGAKIFGIIFSMTWNYLLYRNVVFLKRAAA